MPDGRASAAASTTGTRSSGAPVRGVGRRRARARPGHLPGRRERGLRRRRRPGRAVRPAGGPGVHPDLRATTRRDRRRRRRRWTSAPAKSTAPDPDRPKAPRRATPRRPASRRRRATGRPSERRLTADRRPRPRRRRARPGRAMTLEIDVLTLFPAMIAGPLAESIPGRIQERASRRSGSTTCATGGSAAIGRSTTPRTAGAPGWSCAPEPVAAALDALREPDSTAILLDPAGEVFRQARAADLAARVAPRLRLSALRGRRRADPGPRRPRALDRRLRRDRRRAAGAGRHRRRHPAAARAPSTRRPRPRNRSAPGCSSTRSTPGRRRSAGMDVPAILTSGDHGAVARWRQEQALERTRERRPDLLPPDDRRRR